jgi:serine/threonine protein kinase
MPLGTLGRYEIIREIARSNDIVYEAWDPTMDRRVAVKELHMPQGATERQREERKQRFLREARAAGKLEHPNIVSIYEVGEDQGRMFIAMEFLEGGTLRDKMDREGALSQEEAVEIFSQVLDGLAFAHERGVVHRDIKPENIQLLPDGRVVITDFGIARLKFEPSITMDGQIFGTPSYMSPEQVVGREIDERTDIWSCGVVLYEALAGEKPFTGDSVVTISHRIMHSEPPDPPNVSWAMRQVIRRALDKAPSERFSSAKEMKRALADALTAASGGGDSSYSGASPWGPPLDPYAAPQSSYGTPYGQPYGVPGGTQGTTVGPPAPPTSQPYAYGQPYTGGSLPAPPAFPPGWTSPPRAPLFSPAAAEFLRRTFIVVLVGGLLLTAAVGVIAFFDRAAEQSRLEQIDRTLLPSIEEAEAIMATDPVRAAARLQELLDRAGAENTRKRIQRSIAACYLNVAERQMNSDLESALQNIASAAEIAPDEAEILGRGAALSYEAALRVSARPVRLSLLEQSGALYERAYDLLNADGRERVARDYARALYQLAILYRENGDPAWWFAMDKAVALADESGDKEFAAELRQQRDAQ